jgi:ribonuclease D
MVTSVTQTPRVMIYQGDISDKALQHFLSQDALGCDTETNGLCPERNNLQLIQICSRDNKVAFVQYRKNIEPTNVRILMAASNVVKIFHHAPFDLGFLGAHAKVKPSNIFCTKIASMRIRGAKGPKGFHKLATISEEILSVPLDKSFMDGNNLPDWTGELTPEHIEYGTNDVVVLLPLYDYFCERLGPSGVAEVKSKSVSNDAKYY